MPIAENINAALTCTPSTTGPPFVEGPRPPGMSLREACQKTHPPPEGKSRKQQPYLVGFRRRRLDLARQFSVNPSPEKWPGDDPPRTEALSQSHADPPFLGNRLSGIILREAYQKTHPPPEGRSQKQQPYPAGFRRRRLDLARQLNMNPSPEKWPGDDPPRIRRYLGSSGEATSHGLVGVLTQCRYTTSP
jgi:hypothetical protein